MIKKIIGALLMASPFICILATTLYEFGLIAMLVEFTVPVLTLGVVWVGIYLFTRD